CARLIYYYGYYAMDYW
nr:immunoglobulin heavy chain junction region [Mus musculus]MBK4185115.1 immunoglobulin heavy chain junction region [Mus musculus]